MTEAQTALETFYLYPMSYVPNMTHNFTRNPNNYFPIAKKF
jgi:hypothetical protein